MVWQRLTEEKGKARILKSFLEISAMKKEVPPSRKLQEHEYEKQNL